MLIGFELREIVVVVVVIWSSMAVFSCIQTAIPEQLRYGSLCGGYKLLRYSKSFFLYVIVVYNRDIC